MRHCNHCILFGKPHNGFPKQIIKRFIHKRINFLKHNNNTNNTTNCEPPDKIPYISLPYVKDVTDNVAYSLKNSGLRVVYSLPKKLNTIIKCGKDLVTKDSIYVSN